ncbi:MAG: hypothetical protein ACTSO3_01035 [Candidatus Heimdallarchaeaceae archaeon]
MVLTNHDLTIMYIGGFWKLSKLAKRARKRKTKQKTTKVIKRKGKINPERLIKAIEDSYGNIETIAYKMNRSYAVIYKHIKNAPPEIKDIYDRENERILDVAEETVVDMAMQRLHFPTALNASKFILTHHKKSESKGYKEKRQLTLEGGENPLKVQNENVVSLDEMKSWPLSLRKKMLAEMEEKEKDED